MKIFPCSDPIQLPLSPTIASTIADYLQSIAHKSNINSLQQNWAGDIIELQPDLYGHGEFQRSIRQIPTSQYQYVSTIAHQLAAKSSLTPLEICQNLDIPIPTSIVVKQSVHLELDFGITRLVIFTSNSLLNRSRFGLIIFSVYHLNGSMTSVLSPRQDPST